MAEKKKQNARQEAQHDVLVWLWLRFERFGWDVLGVLVLALALMTLLGVLVPQQAGGTLLRAWVTLLQRWFGWGSLFVAVALGITGLALLRRRLEGAPPFPWGRVVALEVAAFALLVVLSLAQGQDLSRAQHGLDGGLVGWGLAELLSLLLGRFGAGLLSVFLLLLGLSIGLNLPGSVRSAMRGKGRSPDEAAAPAVVRASAENDKPSRVEASPARRKSPSLAPEFRKNFRLEKSGDEKPAKPLPRPDTLPPLDLLSKERLVRPSERHINQRAGLIEQTLAEFGIPAKVVGFQIGPTVTQFAVEPGYIEKPGASEDELDRLRKVRVSQIAGLQRDLALALAVERLRIQAPVPGRPYIGIEVPNAESVLVRLRPILESAAFQKVRSPLAIALGRDVSGEPVVADLAAMPHLLIAGTTGSGKSVGIAAITTCLVMNNAPEDLRLVMIDPKMVELIRFNGLPHLYGKVETDLERILAVLRWVVAEMDRRYVLLEESRSRNMDTYNRKVARRGSGEKLPRIVVLIDELADLMMSAPEQTEHNLVRLAQMARATGIHLVVATQRPSTDVVTGLIKANFPARLSFAVASSVDSRVILDTPGAEHLLGNGDMLFLPPEAAAPMRVQGVWVDDREVEKVVNYWQGQVAAAEEEPPPWEEMMAQEAMLAERDNLLTQAIRLVQQTQRASASMLQRQLRVGYPRAARLIDELEELGVVGPSRGGGREREVLIGEEDDISDILSRAA
ncbi:MAG: DNA translocase FtsK [Anaerolineae bacterium]|nr:MAG: DNA translocase FtsK [Anaerolineae bacterium]